MSNVDWEQIRSRLNRARLRKLEGEIRNDVVPFRAPRAEAERERKIQNAFEQIQGRNLWFERQFSGAVMGTPLREPESDAQLTARIDSLLAITSQLASRPRRR